MMWLIGGFYCFVLWLIFDKFKLLRLSLPIAIVAASIGPALILSLLFCSQYYHPYSSKVIAFQKVIPIRPQLAEKVRVTRIAVQPNSPIKKGDVLFEVDTSPYDKAIANLLAAVDQSIQGIEVAKASVAIADASVKRAKGDLEFMSRERARQKELLPNGAITQEEYEDTLTRYQQAASALDQSEATNKQSRLSVQVSEAKLRQAQTSLEDARYDREQTTIVAPADGYVTNLQLQIGMLVGGALSQPVMSFVQDRTEEEQGVVIALIDQKNYLLVKQGQYAEVIMNSYPGQVFTGRVQNAIDVSGSGQLTASGALPEMLGTSAATKFAVKIVLDEGKSLRLPAGSNGQAAIYTEHVPIAGIPIMVVIRAQSWLRFVL